MDSDGGPILDTYFVGNKDGKLPKVTLVNANPNSLEIAEHPWRLKLNGTERQIFRKKGGLASDLFHDLPLLDRIYGMLKEDLQAEYDYNFS